MYAANKQNYVIEYKLHFLYMCTPLIKATKIMY